jgi:hypothetical protein
MQDHSRADIDPDMPPAAWQITGTRSHRRRLPWLAMTPAGLLSYRMWLTVSRVSLTPPFDESNGRRNRLIPRAVSSSFPALRRVDNPNPFISFNSFFDVVLNSSVLHGRSSRLRASMVR